MHQHFSLFEVFLLTGISQGFIVALLILANRERSISKLLLSFVLIAFNLLCIRILILTTGLWQTSFLRYFPLPLELAIPPLLWLYISSLVKPDFRFTRATLYHFIPFGISFAYSLLVYLLVVNKEAIGKDLLANRLYFNEVKRVEDYLMVVSAVLYWAWGMQLILRYRSWLYNHISSTSFPTYTWLRNISLLLGVLIISLTADIVLDYVFHFGTVSFIHWRFFFVYLSGLIYYLGFRGYQLPDAVSPVVLKPGEQEQQSTLWVNKAYLPVRNCTVEEERNTSPVVAEATTEKETVPEQPHDTESPAKELPVNRERAVKLTNEKAAEIVSAVKYALENKELFLDPELSLEKLASTIRLPAASVSYVINTHFKKSFRNLVNEYRVAKVKERLADPQSERFSILGIAYECGFNSEASFYRIFKSVAGLSPKEYLKSIMPPD